ncbi:MAG: amino acid--tRNA ligase-related protein [bacterium]
MGITPTGQRLRSRLFEETRRFFTDREYLEVDVPVLAESLIPEPHLEVFETHYLAPYEDPQERRPLYLTPSPEVYLKRLLAAGWPSLFCLSRAFRNAESIGRLHNPEFTMLEFYTRGADYLDSAAVTRLLLTHLLESLSDEAAAYRQERGRPGREGLEALRPPFRRHSVDELMQRHAGAPGGWASNRETLAKAARAADLSPDPEESFESIFNHLFVHRVEPALSRDGAVLVRDYPAEVATLAKRRENSPWSERWELYLCGLEVANCYTEETRPEEVATFFQSERARKQTSFIVHPVDPGYPSLFEGVQEPISGVAVGMDRLLMALVGAEEIEEVMAFPARLVV